jgi:integrase
MWFWRMPATDWIGPRAAPRFSTDWRPFTGPLAPTSQKLAVTILTALAEWLTRQQYLSTNPWDGVPPSHNLDGRMRTDHALTPAQWKVTLAACEPIDDAETRLRLRFTLLAAYALGLRLAELAGMQMARRTETAGELNLGLKPGSDGEGWDLEVLGKRQKRRRIPVPSAVMAALADYLQVSGKGNDPEGWPAGEPLIATLPGRGGTRSALSTSGLYRMLKRHFAMAAREMETARDAGHLLAASTHWLRHTHATHSLAAGVPIEAVQENMGHSSVAITAIYSHAGRKRRKAAVDTLMAFAGET